MKNLSFKILVFSAAAFFLIFYFRSALPYIEYELNKKYIAKNLCENKSKPLMNCNGKCYLKKKIKKTEKQEEKHTPFISTEHTLLFLIRNTETKKENISNFENFIHYNLLYSFHFLRKIFKPPQFFPVKY